MERLDKYISNQSGMSRKQAREAIWKGNVAVNGAAEKTIDRKIDPDKDEITLDGRPVSYREYLYIMMNKPAGYVSATRDRDERTVLELLPEEFRRSSVAPAGRLDKDTLGLLILTDDGAFAHRLTAPGKQVYKTYVAKLDAPADGDMAARFAQGIELADGDRCLPASLTWEGDGSEVTIKICQGMYHQVKRMCAACGRKVLELRRTAIGQLSLDVTLAPGECRLLSEQEREYLLISDK